MRLLSAQHQGLDSCVSEAYRDSESNSHTRLVSLPSIGIRENQIHVWSRIYQPDHLYANCMECMVIRIREDNNRAWDLGHRTSVK
jgi:hypothetical protein